MNDGRETVPGYTGGHKKTTETYFSHFRYRAKCHPSDVISLFIIKESDKREF